MNEHVRMQVHWSAGRPGERGGEAVTVPLRPVAAPFVAVAQAGARVRARLRLAPEDEAVLRAVGGHLGSLAGRDLAARCTDGRMDARAKAASRATRKKALTAESSSRWAGAITRTSEDQHQLAEQNLRAERASLRARIGRIQARLAVPAAGQVRPGPRVRDPGGAACQGDPAAGAAGPHDPGGAAPGGGGGVRGAGRQGPTAHEEQSRRHRADRGSVAAGVGSSPAVPDR